MKAAPNELTRTGSTRIVLPIFQKDYSEWVVERADKIATPGMVSSQIINRLHDVELVIADLSFHNANAFYEMSIRHKVGKPIIHMIRKGEKIPFDVIPHRAIPFSHVHPDEHERARELLCSAVQEAILPDFEPDNPITHARGRLELEQHATPEMRVLMDQMEALQSQLNFLDGFVRSFAANAPREYSERIAMMNALFTTPPPSTLRPAATDPRLTPGGRITPSGAGYGSNVTVGNIEAGFPPSLGRLFDGDKDKDKK